MGSSHYKRGFGAGPRLKAGQFCFFKERLTIERQEFIIQDQTSSDNGPWKIYASQTIELGARWRLVLTSEEFQIRVQANSLSKKSDCLFGSNYNLK